ncbi:MAG TPA: glycerol-3-phosphate dehydrogenase [Aquabacterium sp.]|nr:glycerol-3-phosphate dehydrogenase [Aquabacterium sp.]
MNHIKDPSASQHASGDAPCDVLVIGGGLHGVAVARDLAGRGWSVILCEQGDLAQHASSSTLKLALAGVDALAFGRLKPLRQSLVEQEVLLRSAPHLCSPVRLIVPEGAGAKPLWRSGPGLWLLNQLAPRTWLPDSQSVSLSGSSPAEPLQPSWRTAVMHSELLVDDARLVVACAQDGRDHGAHILTRAHCAELRAHDDGWQALLAHHDPHTDRLTHQTGIRARLVVNAAGASAGRIQAMLEASTSTTASPAAASHDTWVKGGHIVISRRQAQDHGHWFEVPGGRSVFAVPLAPHFTLIGAEVLGPVTDSRCTALDPQDIEHLCQVASRYFRSPVMPQDVVWQQAIVHAPDRLSSLAHIRHCGGPAPWVTARSGRMTTFRRQAEAVVNQVAELFSDHRPPWTRESTLPGGRLIDLIDAEQDPVSDLIEFQRRLRQRFPWLDLALARRWSRQYGSRVLSMLEGVQDRSELGAEVAPDLYELELRHLMRTEWARTADDVLWRRTRLGLHLSEPQHQAVAQWLQRSAAV